MLLRLKISNYALISESEISFDSGLTVITGETGAGKSILMGALSIVLGARADSSVIKQGENKTMIIIALSMGLRFSDIANLKLTDIDWEKKVINIRQKKTGTPLSLPLNITVQNEIAKYLLEERPDCDAEEVFITKVPPFKKLTGSPKCFEYYCKIADIEKIKKRSFHSLRRTFASSLSEEQVPLPTISQLLGHKNSDYDRPYLSYDKEKMQLCSLALDEIPFNTKESLFIGEIKE